MDKKEKEPIEQLIDVNPELQTLIDEINEELDAGDEDEDEGSSQCRSPFAMEGTVFDGMTDEDVGEI